MSPLADLAALLSALLYFLAFSRPPAPVGSDEGSMVMPVKSLHTLLVAGAGAAAPAGAAANVTPVAETAATHRTRINLRILWCSLLEDVPKDDGPGATEPEYRLLISADLVPGEGFEPPCSEEPKLLRHLRKPIAPRGR